jgi:hypothetical protein
MRLDIEKSIVDGFHTAWKRKTVVIPSFIYYLLIGVMLYSSEILKDLDELSESFVITVLILFFRSSIFW